MPIICHLKFPAEKPFTWKGDGCIKYRRRPTELYYRSFIHGDLKVDVNDFVLVRNDEAMDPESEENCFVAKVLDLYETDDKDVPYKAKVQWYSRIFELPPQYTRNLPKKDYLQEVIEDHRSQFSDVIDAESIFSVNCIVITVKEDFISKPPKNPDVHVFFCRYKFNGSTVIPLMPSDKKTLVNFEDSVSSNRLKEKRPSRVNGEDKYQEIASIICTPRRVKKRICEEQKVFDNHPLKPLKICLPKLESVFEKLTCGTTPLKKNGITKSHNDLHLVGTALKSPKGFKFDELKEQIKLLKNEIDFKPDIKLSQEDKVKSTRNLRKRSNRNNVSPEKLSIKSETSTKKPLVKDEIITENSFSDFAQTPINKYTTRNVASEMKAKSLRRSTRKSKSELSQTVPSKKTNTLQIKKTPDNKRTNARRSLKFESNKQDDKECSSEVTTTRYGRQVKAVSNFLESELDALLSTPKKIPEKSPAFRKNTKFYHSSGSDDDSDNESAYVPSGESSEDEEVLSPPLISPENVKKRSKKNKQMETNVVRTPRSTKKPQILITPTIPGRHEPVKTPQSLLEESRQRLHVSAVPSSLPCREEEFFDIFSFVRSNLMNGTGGCMYVSGVPGTGKTATVHEVIRNLKKERALDHLPSFQFVEVNGMKMTDPYQCYVQIFQKLTGERVMPQQAANLLEKRFTQPGPKNKAVVLLVDELDKLWTRKQTVMYNLFDWPSKPESKLIVVAIANTMDLPERIMMNRISSRLGLTRKTFQPYTFKELQEIVMSRIKELDVFNPDAVQLVARKVAAISGDARRALEICRRAAEISEEGSVKESPTKKRKMLVGMAHVDAALNQMFSSPVIAAIKGSSELQKMFLKAVLSEFQRTGSEETDLRRCRIQLVPLCRFEGLRPPSSSEISKLCVYLASSSILLINNIQSDLHMKIRLNVSIDDVVYALTGRMP